MGEKFFECYNVYCFLLCKSMNLIILEYRQLVVIYFTHIWAQLDDVAYWVVSKHVFY